MNSKLTKRETQCLMHAANDKSIKETSDLLCISPYTVKKHRSQLLSKMGCQSLIGVLWKVLHENSEKGFVLKNSSGNDS